MALSAAERTRPEAESDHRRGELKRLWRTRIARGGGNPDRQAVLLAVGKRFGLPGVAGGFRGVVHGDGGLGSGPADLAGASSGQ